MASDEVLTALRRELEEVHGVEAAAYLMGRPQGGWDSLMTKDEFHAEMKVFRLEMQAELEQESFEARRGSSPSSWPERKASWSWRSLRSAPCSGSPEVATGDG